MRIVAVLQARLGSTRLPGKALKEINGLPIIVHIWRRLMRCLQVDECIVAWGGNLPTNTIFNDYGMRAIAGSEDNLLDRLMLAGHYCHADAILRVRADCLFLDPALLDEMVRHYRDMYPIKRGVTNWPARNYSEGLDAEVWSMELLAELDRTKECPREDFGTWAIEHGLCSPMYMKQSDGEPHLSIDTQEDFERATKMIEWLERNRACSFDGEGRYRPWKYSETLKAWEATK